jgi:hypothetical protein
MEKQMSKEEYQEQNPENNRNTVETAPLIEPGLEMQPVPTRTREEELEEISKKEEQIRQELRSIPVEDMSRLDTPSIGEVNFMKKPESRSTWWKKLSETGLLMLGGLGLSLSASAKEGKHIDSTGTLSNDTTISKMATPEGYTKITYIPEHKEYKHTALEGKVFIPTPDSTKEVYALSVTGSLKGKAALEEVVKMVHSLGYELEDVHTLDLIAKLHKNKLPDVISIKNTAMDNDDTQVQEKQVVTSDEHGNIDWVSPHAEHAVFPIIDRLGNVSRVEYQSILDLGMHYDYRILVSRKKISEDAVAVK